MMLGIEARTVAQGVAVGYRHDIVMMKPTVAGTRITVELILRKLGAGVERRANSRFTSAAGLARRSWLPSILRPVYWLKSFGP